MSDVGCFAIFLFKSFFGNYTIYGCKQENRLEIIYFQNFYVLLPMIIAIHDAKERN
jgi:hypothetical protein